MKQKFFRVILVCMLFVMLTAVAACSKSDNDNSDKDANTAVNNETEGDTQDVSKDSPDETDVESDKADASDSDLDSEDGQNNSTESKDDQENKDEADTNEVLVGELPLVEIGIKGVYEPFGMKAGTCISDNVISQSKYADHIIANYNSVTMENDMKPDYTLNKNKSIEADDIVVEFSQRTIKMLQWAKDNGIAVRGHTIVWHSQTPQWIFHEGFDQSKPKVDRDTMLKRMESYIKQVFEQLETLGYLDIFYAYDVVNEAIMEDGSYRDSSWKQIIGDDYLWFAFHYADKYAPESVKLYYNDYNEQFKTEHIVKLAKTLVDEDGRSLIDGIGCQAHLYTKDSIDSYMETLEAFSALGLDVQITEIDVSLGEWTNILPPTQENLMAQGQYYYELVNRIAESNEAGTTNISGITFWGVSDSLSWRSDRNPLLFDKTFKPKYAYFGAVQDKEHAGY